MCPFLIVSTCVFFCPFSGGMYGMPPLMDRYGLGMPIGPATMVCCKDYSILGLGTPETCNPFSYFFVHDKWSKYQVVLWLLSRSFWPFFLLWLVLQCIFVMPLYKWLLNLFLFHRSKKFVSLSMFRMHTYARNTNRWHVT